jgi:tryptophan synthase alpha chain
MNLTNPVLIGFGIKDRATFVMACSYSSGAIIGSAFIKALADAEDVAAATAAFVGTIKTA